MTGRRLLLVADGSALLRAGVRASLERHGFGLLEAACVDEAVAAATERPGVSLVGLDLPGDPAAAIEALAAAGAKVLVWDYEPAPDRVLSAVAAGAAGFLRKTVGAADILAAIEEVEAGGAALPPDIAGLLVAAIRRTTSSGRLRGALSSRERRVLELVADDMRNREIAAALGISEFTVKRHVQNILRKLGLPSRKAAAALYELATGPRGYA